MAVKQRKQRLRKKARRDVRAAYEPAFNQLGRAEDRARSDYDFRDAQVQNIYEGLQSIMGPQGGQYDRAVEGIMGDYTKALGEFSSAFSDSFAPAAAIGGAVGDAAAQAGTAAANAYGTVGAGGLALLSNARERNANFFNRMENVGGLAEKDARMNALSDYETFIRELGDRRLDLQGEKKSSFLTQLDNLRQQRTDNQLAKQQFRLNKDQIESQQELADYLIGHIGSESERRAAAARKRRQARRQAGSSKDGKKGGKYPAAGQGWESTGGGFTGNGTGGGGGLTGGPGDRVEQLQNQIARLTGNDDSQKAAIYNIVEEERGYRPGSNARIFMKDGKVYVSNGPYDPGYELKDPRAAKIWSFKRQEGRKVRRKRERVRRIRRRVAGGNKE